MVFEGVLTESGLLAKMQRKATLWILGVFHTSLTGGVEAIAGIIPIHLHLKKRFERVCIRIATLLSTACSTHHSKDAIPHPRPTAFLTNAQPRRLKRPLLDVELSLN